MSKFVNELEQEGGTNPANEWVKYGMRLGVCTIIHPFEYAKALMQVCSNYPKNKFIKKNFINHSFEKILLNLKIGFEPLAPRPGKTIFGSHTLILPNVFQYIGHIRRTDGIIGCFRGCGPKIFGVVVSSFASAKVAERLGLGIAEEETNGDDADLSDSEQMKRFQQQMRRDLVMHVSSVVISHPFHVVTIRMMAEFVGREGRYTGLFASLAEIWRQDGILGFFAGLVPRLLCDVSCLVLVSTSSYYVNKHYIKDRDSRQYFNSISQFIVTSMMYPLAVVSTCMIVSGSGLQAGKPPNMPIFSGWLDCWNHLSATNCLKRGSSLFFRYYRPTSFGQANLSPVPMPPQIKYKSYKMVVD